MSLLKHAATVSGYTLLSRILGFIRDIFIAAKLGTGTYADAFFVALKLPNFFRRLFAEGALNAAFVPLFSGKLSTEKHKDAQLFAENVMSLLLIATLVLTVAMEIAMPWVLAILAPGFTTDPAKYDIAVLLSRITFPYLLFISICAVCSGVLNSLKRFAAGAFIPVILNVCMVVGVLFLSKYTSTPAHALAYSVSVAGMIQLIWMLVACRRAGMRFRLHKPKLTNEVKLMLKRMIPGIVGAGIIQINVWIDVVLATLIPGAVSFLYYADRLNQFPLALIGTAIGIALLPMLSRQIREERFDDALISQNRAIEFAMLLTIPAALALVVIAFPLIYVMFGYGQFTQQDAQATAYALTAYGIGLPGFVLIKILSPNFFARGDTITPVKIAMIGAATNIILSLALIKPLAHVGLALATSTAALVNAGGLAYLLYTKERFQPDARLKTRCLKMIIASFMMAVILYGLTNLLMPYITSSALLIRIAALIGLVIAGTIAYGIMVLTSKAFSLQEFKAIVRRNRKNVMEE